MARDRAGSSTVGGLSADGTLFVGARVPNEIRKMVPHLKSIGKPPFRKILQVICEVFEGKLPEDGVLSNLESEALAEEVLASVYSGLHTLLVSALRLPQVSLKPEQFTADLVELKIPNELIPDLKNVVFGERRSAMEAVALANKNRLPKLDCLRWRVDVAISTSALNRVLEPSIFMEMKLSDGKIHMFEVPLSKFHELRYNAAYVLKEMEDVEKKSILKIQD